MRAETIRPRGLSGGRLFYAPRRLRAGFAPAIAAFAAAAFANPVLAAPSYAIAMHGDPALPTDYTHFPYADPNARKGGKLTLGVLGTFDSVNPFNVKSGSAAEGLVPDIFQSLMTRSMDEPFTMYGLIAKSVETDAARDYVLFRLDPRARFSDGSPITAADVRFTFDLLKTKGRPQQRSAADPRIDAGAFAQGD
jgi:peptide/nickel transport system substrate-binding protein